MKWLNVNLAMFKKREIRSKSAFNTATSDKCHHVIVFIVSPQKDFRLCEMELNAVGESELVHVQQSEKSVSWSANNTGIEYIFVLT